MDHRQEVREKWRSRSIIRLDMLIGWLWIHCYKDIFLSPVPHGNCSSLGDIQQYNIIDIKQLQENALSIWPLLSG
ncbi:hypothetical protein SLEP1_g41326 [Rubroshorea leprosula]|uniref:Uncharacterized protein n=1 Tax=Rubroshorea leprosula TaxID=152421 RepID=A0AAV5L755_9ROSI|nr:hypothetical protein SLEP1_g41326 [Rubroshorea leprosula]